MISVCVIVTCSLHVMSTVDILYVSAGVGVLSISDIHCVCPLVRTYVLGLATPELYIHTQ